MSGDFRVIDSGLRPGREQIAFDQALVDMHQQSKVPDTLRFMQFRPTVLIGRHQALAREVRLDYCGEHGIDIARRLTGGGAIYMDQGQLGWELVFNKASLGEATLPNVTRRICEAAAAGLSELGVQASYRPFSDIEVNGRKISGTGGYFDGDTLIYQGTVLMAMDPSVMVKVLNIPQAAKDDGAGKAEQQIVTLSELLGHVPELEQVKQVLIDAFAEHLGITARPEAISDAEFALAREYHDSEIGTDAFVQSIDDPASDPNVLTATQSTGGGRINAYVRLEGEGGGRVRQILVSGDFFVAPGRTVLDLESSLRGLPVARVPDAVDEFFERTPTGLMSVKPDDFRQAIAGALAKATPQ